jgi:hypothetical protein
MNRQVVQMVRSLDVQAAQAHMLQTTGNPFLPAPSEVNDRFYTGDENTLIALINGPMSAFVVGFNEGCSRPSWKIRHGAAPSRRRQRLGA